MSTPLDRMREELAKQGRLPVHVYGELPAGAKSLRDEYIEFEYLNPADQSLVLDVPRDTTNRFGSIVIFEFASVDRTFVNTLTVTRVPFQE